ncbi:hypothetical protein PYH37_003294 [Sinorhizobium numidicum]|uniref:Uncharacterized protein n=1 Tax=Sinorhizobium numidicum TaxID=680248 RepID=A0ABY8D304_9HYPH|nr:hypothetical protein [Sinorhizobium numidicum]WEX79281.1 hypothetical protein PYH37_003294 [Sinorhizobium numidicum]WEX85261.1 hypothetical protein PYH38_004007 [Sinorhizobium numidicum]
MTITRSRHPDTGLTVVAISPMATDPEFVARTADHLRRLTEFGVHVPGSAKRRNPPEEWENIEIEAAVLGSIRGFVS